MLPSGGQRTIQTLNKTNTSRKTLKPLTEDSNQQPSMHATIISKKKKQQHNSKTKNNNKIPKGCSLQT